MDMEEGTPASQTILHAKDNDIVLSDLNKAWMITTDLPCPAHNRLYP